MQTKTLSSERIMQRITAILRKAEYSFTTTEWTEYEDANIEITDRVSIQIGDGYAIVNRWADDDSAMYHHPITSINDAARIVEAELELSGA